MFFFSVNEKFMAQTMQLIDLEFCHLYSCYWNLFFKPRGEVRYICVALYLDLTKKIMFEFGDDKKK